MQDIQTLLQQIAKHFGYSVGAKVKEEIEKVVNAENIDIQKLQSAIATIQKLLDADPNTPEFDVGQNIVTQLSDHLARITKLENAVNILNGDENTAGSVDYKIKQAIDKVQGDTQTNLGALQKEVDAIEAGAGLDENGNYVADTNANYIKSATSIHNATQILDTELKKLADKEAQDVADVKTYADNTFVTKEEIANINVCAIASMFAQAIDCGLSGKTEKDCTGDDCSATSGSGSASGTATTSGSGNATTSGSGSASGDGAVL